MSGGSRSIGPALAFEFTPAVIFGSSVAYATATWMALAPFSTTPAAAGAAAFGGIWLGLNKFGSQGRALSLPEFEQPPLQLSPVSELLEQADVVAIVEQLGANPAAKREIEDELVLEDVLEAIESDSRVVRLFEPSDTAGEMQARIERHLHSTRRQAQADAAQELHEALAALRRSLR
jgi:hypothetical protein